MPHETRGGLASYASRCIIRDWWFDEEGRPARSRITYTPPDHKVEATYSGFDEQNLITAPIATPTPWPTPMLIPAPSVTITAGTAMPVATATPLADRNADAGSGP